MRPIYTLMILLSSLSCFSQGNITAIEIYPSAPLTTDNVYLIAHLSFSSGSCEKQSFSASVVGNNVIASAHHCTGMLTVICDISDTTNLGVLPAGLYNVDLTLSSGAAPIPCSPGFAPDDNDTMSFIVALPSTGIVDQYFQFGMSPNPTNGKISLSGKHLTSHLGSEIKVYTSQGKLAQQSTLTNDFSIDVSSLPAGLYFVKILNFTSQRLMKYD